MKINITKKQYKILLELLYLGDWVINARFTENDDEFKKDVSDLSNYFRSFAKDFGTKENELTYSKELNQYFFAKEKELEVHNYIEEYNEDVFWEELQERLVMMEFDKIYHEDIQKKMSIEERFQKIREIENKYDQEFETNGIENLYVNFLTSNLK